MKKILVGAIIISMLAGSTLVQGAEHVADTETRKASIELNGVEVEFEETLHECEQGYRIGYSAELLKPEEFGGNECFIPKDEEEALGSAVKFIIVVEDDENTVLTLDETLAAYENSGEPYGFLEISEVETETLESGLLLDTAQVTCDDTFDSFYLLRDEAEENAMYITASMPVAEKEAYLVWFDRMVESIEFTAEELVAAEFTPTTATTQVCSLCEQEKVCGVYYVKGQEYLVCDDDYVEFAYAFGLPHTVKCDLCEEEKPVEIYEVDGQTYYVCDDDYAEFAHAFGLDSNGADDSYASDDSYVPYEVCDLCEELKAVGEYEVDGVVYYVCDDDYAEFAHAFGLDSYEEDDSSASYAVCDLCEEMKAVEAYEVDGVVYYICDDDYAEFAYAFDLN